MNDLRSSGDLPPTPVPDDAVRKWLADIGRLGGIKSRRVLAPDSAPAMVRIREARRAYRMFHARCFWSYDPEYRIGEDDVAWVAAQLKKNGNREAWFLAKRLCR